VIMKDYELLSSETLREIIKLKRQKLRQFKTSGFFKSSEITHSNKYASLEARRRRNEIENLLDELRRRGEKI